MDTNTGEIVPAEVIAEMNEQMRKRFVEVKRDLTTAEESAKQINLYSPCGCGSGKKFKFCCHKPTGTGMSTSSV